MKKICDNKMTFSECELAILRSSVDLAEKKKGKRLVNTPEIQEIIKIVEDFIKLKSLVCYGGIAIDALLPEEDKIYDKDFEISDYDCYSSNAVQHAKELCDIFIKNGYTEVEAKAGIHHGTYKVYCNFLAVVDITYMPSELFDVIKKDGIRINGILFCPPNFLKMAMYLELSRPVGDISRWEKVFKRLNLLNKHYPLTKMNCNQVNFQREMEDKTNSDIIYENIRDTLVNQGVVFFGGYAISLYSQYMPTKLRKNINKFADFDVLSNDPEVTVEIVKERLDDIGIKKVKVLKRESIGEIVPEHYEIKVNNDTVAFVYKPIACHSYNVIKFKSQKIKIATIDTMLSFYLAFLYTKRPYFNEFSDRILCMSKFLFDVQQKNRLKQKGLLRRFSITCYGHQETLEDLRKEKTQKYHELKNKPNSKEYEEWFLSYKPKGNDTKKKNINNDKYHEAYKVNKDYKDYKDEEYKQHLFNAYNENNNGENNKSNVRKKNDEQYKNNNNKNAMTKRHTNKLKYTKKNKIYKQQKNKTNKTNKTNKKIHKKKKIPWYNFDV